MADCANVNGGLSRDNLGIQRRHLAHIEVFQCLRCQVILCQYSGLLQLDDLLSAELLEDEGGFCLGSLGVGCSVHHFSMSQIINKTLTFLLIARGRAELAGIT